MSKIQFKGQVLSFLLVLVCFSCASEKTQAVQQRTPSVFQFTNLPYGELEVGFQSEMIQDPTRLVDDSSRTIRLGIWYPSGASSDKLMTYSNYIEAAYANEKDTATEAIEGYWQYASNSFGASREDFDGLMNETVRASLDIEPKSEKYPLILYAASFNMGIHENTPLWEYLASHGYVVAAIASVGDTGGGMTADALGVEAQLNDLKLALNHMRSKPFVDMEKIASSGFSWGGFPSTLISYTEDIDAVFTFDGSHSYFPNLITHYGKHYEQPLKAPYLQLNQRPAPNARLAVDTTIYHLSSEAYLFRFNSLDHIDFGAAFQYNQNIASDSLFSAGQARFEKINSIETKAQGYKTIAQLVHLMLDGYLKDDAESRRKLYDFSDDQLVWNLRRF